MRVWPALDPRRSLTRAATRLESEGGADSWERPRPKHIVESRDSIGTEPSSVFLAETNDSTVFQQVDIDGSYDNLSIGPQFHMFGVTQV